MNSDDVKIGQTYMAIVSGRLVPVRIEAVHHAGGWRASNLASNRIIHIKSTRQLRGPAFGPTAPRTDNRN